jgi:predicted alpha-1,6-mannanase (GH76 family)
MQSKRRLCRRAVATIAALTASAGLASMALADSARATDHRVSPQAKAAAEAVMRWYDPSTGLWKTTNWWNAANILTGLMDLDLKDRSQRYVDVAASTYERGIDQQDGNFVNEYLDDTGWWGLAWLRAYELTGERRYLETAIADAEAMWKYRDDHCGGGIWWNHDKNYKNSITNELFIKLAAQLHNTLRDDTVWLARAKETWHWFRDSGVINADYSISDGLNNATCENDGTTLVYTYNQGVILGALVELDKAGVSDALPMAHRIAQAAVTSPTLAPGGILAEPGEPHSDGGADGPTFKGVFTRNLDELDRYVGGRPLYREFLQRQARSIVGHARNDAGQYGYHWAGPFDMADAARQGSALDALIAARPDRVLTLTTEPAFPGGPAVVEPGGTSPALTTSFTNGGRTPATDVRVRLLPPAGWTAEPQGRARSDRVRQTDSLTTTWRIEAPAGAAPGAHTIRAVVDYRTPGHAGTRSVTASTRVVVPNPPSRCVGASGGFCPLDLAHDYNHDGVASVEQPSEGNFDGLGWSYAADLLPPAGPLTLGSVPYQAPSTAGTDENFVEAAGQPLVLPPGKYAVAHVLGAAHSGNVDTNATVVYADGGIQQVPLRLTDWAGGGAFGNSKALPMAYRIRAGQGRDGPAVAIFGTTLPLDATKTVRWIVLPGDRRVELYALTLQPG